MSTPVLIAEDNRSMAKYLVSLVNTLGYTEVETVADGRQALDMITKKKYSFIILDNSMPGMTGIDILRDMKYSNISPGTPVMMVTAAASPALISTIRNESLPVSSLLAKPFSVETFQEKFNIIARHIRPTESGANSGATDEEGAGRERRYTGAKMQSVVVNEDAYVEIILSGIMSNDDRFVIKKAFDSAIIIPKSVMCINMIDVKDFDQFFLGFLLMFTGTLSGGGRQVYIVAGKDSRLRAVGVDQILTTVSDLATFHQAIGYTTARKDAA